MARDVDVNLGAHTLEHGDVLENDLVQGRLYGPKHAPLIVIPGGISASRFVADGVDGKDGSGGWWSDIVYPGGPIDLNRVQVLGLDCAPGANDTKQRLTITIDDDALEVWAIKSEGDARRALTALEVAVLSSDTDTNTLHITKHIAEDSIQQKVANYGPDGHYDAASAMIKSVRGSDPDAALYWIARMLDAGEDPRFIARRLAILASEDIGNADPRGIMVAQAAWDLVERIGMPEARITIAQCATYLACCPKSNAAYVAIDAALDDVRNDRVLPVPIYLRDKNTSPQSTESGAGDRVRNIETEKYQYSHNSDDQLSGQDYLGVNKRYYEPKNIGAEKILKQHLDQARTQKHQHKE